MPPGHVQAVYKDCRRSRQAVAQTYGAVLQGPRQC